MKRKWIKAQLFIFLFTMLSALAISFQGFAQDLKLKITGTVTSAGDKQPLPGAAVTIKGGTVGTSTDLDGKYTIAASTGDVLVFSSIAFVQQEIKVGTASQINVEMQDDVSRLEEVVVIGYGVQKKKLVTGANVNVKGDDLQKQSTTNALQALQGQAPGIQISSTSGQPGEGLKVLVRGLGTTGNAGPLYVVDGVIAGDISYLNPTDIQSIDILKDAASAAIYGSQSANGVVLITTKTGSVNQRPQITFDAYTGTQRAANLPRLLNSREYASIMNEAAINSGKAPYFSNDQIAALGNGTNWLDEMFVNNALTQNYVLGASGGSDASVYSLSLSYTGQEGIVGGKDLSNYDRFNFRVNTEHKLYKNVIRLGQHLTLANTNNNGIGVGNQYNNTLRGAFNTTPFVPMYDEAGNYFDNSASEWNNGESNPYAQMVFGNQNRNNRQNLVGDIYLITEPIKGLTFRSSLGLNYYANEGRSFTPIYKLSIYAFNDNTRVNQSMGKGKTITWDNQLSYKFNLNTAHNFEVMAGTSSYKFDGSDINGSNRDLIFADLEHAWLSNASNKDGTTLSLGGGPNDEDKRMSYFGRLLYNYKETYLLNGTFRADGSSRFARGNRWGYFPSVSAGWVATNEEFLKGSSNWLNFFKLRASWGQVGNQNSDAFQFLAPVTFANTNYVFGPDQAVLTPGAYPSRLGNEDLKWETSEQTDLGFDATFLNNKLTVNFDYYVKNNKDWLIRAPILATAGADAPFINGGNVKNTGFELALNYRSNAGLFNYSVGVNGAYNKNKVGKIPSADGIIHGASNVLFDNSLEFYRAQNNFPIGYFWGLKTVGIFQTEADVAAHTASSGALIQPSAAPGDVVYVDLNDDGIINDQDRTLIGDPNPNYTFGLNLTAEYKGFDFALQASGVAGNQIVQSWRNQANNKANYSAAILDRWHGPGSSNTVPRVTDDNRNWTQFSDLYIQNGDYLKINTITFGYNFGKLIKKSFISQVRLYASALNVYTFTKYNGMDPEIGYGDGFSSGLDLGYYPRPRTFLLGANIKF